MEEKSNKKAIKLIMVVLIILILLSLTIILQKKEEWRSTLLTEPDVIPRTTDDTGIKQNVVKL